MSSLTLDPALIAAWLAARSIARGLPAPVPDRGGLRVETQSDTEVRRWLFARIEPGLRDLARDIREPRHFLKVCASEAALAAFLPPQWTVLHTNHTVMTTAAAMPDTAPPPEGYAVRIDRRGPVSQVRLIASDGSVAASGHAAETAEVFAYDRIETAAAHRRRGLGWTVMATLAAQRRSAAATQVLVATQEGRRLYERLGWAVCSPYATAAIVQGQAPPPPSPEV